MNSFLKECFLSALLYWTHWLLQEKCPDARSCMLRMNVSWSRTLLHQYPAVHLGTVDSLACTTQSKGGLHDATSDELRDWDPGSVSRRLFGSWTWTYHADLRMLYSIFCISSVAARSQWSWALLGHWSSSLVEERRMEHIPQLQRLFPWF